MSFIHSSIRRLTRLGIVIVLVVALVSFFRILVQAPSDFPTPYQLTIESGQTLFSISHELASAHVIRSPRLFEIFMIVLGNEKRVSEGEYYFEKPVSSFEVAVRISGRQFGIDRKKITFPEGFTNKQMAARLGQTFDTFETDIFLTLAKEYEGYLFPDTYGFFPSVTPDVVVTTLRRNFAAQIAGLSEDFAQSPYSKRDIIIMASIIEKEAAGEEDRAVVAGILWKRLDKGIPLQVDAPFLYLLGKESKDLTKTDLAINSLYNTYRNKGLPPTPIDNPGLAAITAALHPEPSPYLYYLHDSDGMIHYAKTYTEHKANIKKFLK